MENIIKWNSYEVFMLLEISSILDLRILVQSAPDFIWLSYLVGRWKRWLILVAVGSASVCLVMHLFVPIDFSTASGNFAGDAVATTTLGLLYEEIFIE